MPPFSGVSPLNGEDRPPPPLLNLLLLAQLWPFFPRDRLCLMVMDLCQLGRSTHAKEAPWSMGGVRKNHCSLGLEPLMRTWPSQFDRTRYRTGPLTGKQVPRRLLYMGSRRASN